VRQGDFLDAVGPVDFPAGVAAAVVEDKPDRVAADVLGQLLQEALEANLVDMGRRHGAGTARSRSRSPARPQYTARTTGTGGRRGDA
jgi:hypothetical protein